MFPFQVNCKKSWRTSGDTLKEVNKFKWYEECRRNGQFVTLTWLRWLEAEKELRAIVSLETCLCRILGQHLLQYPNNIHTRSQLLSYYIGNETVDETDSHITRSTGTLLYFILFLIFIFFFPFPDLFWIYSIIIVLHSMYNCKLNSRVNIIIKEDIKIQITSLYCL